MMEQKQMIKTVKTVDGKEIGELNNILSLHDLYTQGNGGVRANLENANLVGSNLTGANLSDAYLFNANLENANLSNANLSGANLTGANLSAANLARANLSGANLTGANLSAANLARANLSNANLSNANLVGSNLTGTNLSDAYLFNAYLSAAYLSAAYLSAAYLYKVNLTRAVGALQLGPVGKEGRMIYAILHSDGIRVHAGCFWGTLPEFAVRVNKKYGVRGYRHGYGPVLEHLAAWEKTELKKRKEGE